jgi:inhibitor of KinA
MPSVEPHIVPLGDGAAVVRLGAAGDPATSARVRAFAGALKHRVLAGVTEYVPAYATVTVFYDPLVRGFTELAAELAELARQAATGPAPPGRELVVPVCYGGELGPDLGFVAAYCGLREDEVVALHAGASYRVALVGFVGGFPYLEGLPARLAVPRLDHPRPYVAPGSVALAGRQAGIYTLGSPGGWRLIGRTPLVLFDATRSEPAAFEVGDRVRFEPIGLDDYERLAGGRP